MIGFAGSAFTVTVTGAELAVQPNEFETVSPTVPAVRTTILLVVSPVVQVFRLVCGDVNTTESPEQNVVGPENRITGIVGIGLIVNCESTDTFEHPEALVTFTEYLPDVSGRYT